MNAAALRTLCLKLCFSLWSSFRDLLPIIVVVGSFQIFVFRQPLQNADQLLFGLMLVVVGLSMFVSGLQMGLFPLGEGMAHDFSSKGSVVWLLLFAFALGFGTTFAEPALIAVADKAALLRFGDAGDIAANERSRFAVALRCTVALAVGVALAAGVVRIIKGWPIQYFIISGYLSVMLVTPFAPSNIVGIAYDAGGVTTSTITVPLTAALGVGLASSIQGRNPLIDGFGLIALASLTPILFVLAFGILWP